MLVDKKKNKSAKISNRRFQVSLDLDLILKMNKETIRLIEENGEYYTMPDLIIKILEDYFGEDLK